MPRLLACLVVLALLGVVAGAALAARGDPQKKINAADQARAKAMLVRKSDLAPGFKSTPPDPVDDDFYCRAVDESDLTLTGETESPDFDLGPVYISSLSQVYETFADADASWRRGTSVAGEKCLRDGFRHEVQKGGDKFVSFQRISFPRLAQRSAAYRLVASIQGVPFRLDFAVLMQSRAQAAVALGSVPDPSAKAALVRLARIVAARMKTAMRGP